MANRINQRRHEERLPRFPGRDDVEKMLKAVREQDEPSPIKERNIAMLEFLASTGCRVSEMTGLNIKDIDIDNRRTIVIGKGNKERCVYLGKEAIEALKLYWSKRSLSKTDEPIFARHDKGAHSHNNIRLTTTSVRNIVRNVAVLAGLDPGKFTPHYFRHAFAIRVLGETGNLAYTQDLLGHADPKSTRIYAKIYPEDLKRVHSEIFDHKLTTKE